MTDYDACVLEILTKKDLKASLDIAVTAADEVFRTLIGSQQWPGLQDTTMISNLRAIARGTREIIMKGQELSQSSLMTPLLAELVKSSAVLFTLTSKFQAEYSDVPLAAEDFNSPYAAQEAFVEPLTAFLMQVALLRSFDTLR